MAYGNQQMGKPDRSGPVTLASLHDMRAQHEPIACMTAYDVTFAQMEDAAGVDIILVGDSLGMVVQGRDTTVPVTLDHMIYHAAAVSRGVSRSFIMVDLPFMSYTTPAEAVQSARRLMQEGGAQMVKLEGGEAQAEIVSALSKQGVPVCGHIGLTPQFIHKLGGFRVQGRNEQAAEAMLKDAKALVAGGADMLLVECVPNELAAQITQAVDVPVIGIGAGPDVSGQILVSYDLLDIPPGKKPRFVQNFIAEVDTIPEAFDAYVQAVKSQAYPKPEHCFS